MNKVVAAVAIVVLAGVSIYLYSNNKKAGTDKVTPTIIPTEAITPSATESASPTASVSAKITPTAMQENKLIKVDIKIGTGVAATIGKKVTVNYRGTLTDGTEFDSSYKRNEPFSFTLGAEEVIQGWEQGVLGMKVGGKRKLTIPPSLGYGSQSLPGIPANSTLIFEIELLKVE